MSETVPASAVVDDDADDDDDDVYVSVAELDKPVTLSHSNYQVTTTPVSFSIVCHGHNRCVLN